MESKHTPGPWSVEDWQYQAPGREHVPTIVARRNDSAVAEALALWREGNDSTEERNANAAMIAAAPDMYEAIADAMEILLDSWGDEQLAAGDDQVYNVLAAALAKAEGRA